MTTVQDGMFGYLAMFCECCGKALSNPLSMKAHQVPVCRARNGFKMSDKQKQVDMRQWGIRFDYKTPTGNAHCYIKTHHCTVICTEAPDNDGMSITNAAEIVARSVCYAYNIPPDRLMWIEHYAHGDLDIGETFDRVEFIINRDAASYEFVNPRWSPIDADTALKMLEEA